MTKEAVNLTRALKGDNKIQGNWGNYSYQDPKSQVYVKEVSLKPKLASIQVIIAVINRM